MTTFLIAAALLLAVSLALLSRPWWRRAGTGRSSRRDLNTTIYRDQLLELDGDRASGQLADADYQTARAEIQRRLLEDAAQDDAQLVATAHPKRTLVALLVALPLLGAGLYAWLGSPAALDQMQRRDFSQQDVENMVAGLAAKLENEPDNLQGWAMLARSYKTMRRTAEAERAYEKAFALVEQDPQLLADYADLLASKTGDLAGRPEQLIAKALALDPDHLQSLWLAGTAAFNRADYAKAVQHWQRAQRQLPPESEDARMLASIVEEATQKMGTRKAGSATAAAPAATATAIRGRVELAAARKAQAAPSDTVFIIARETGGGPMPLAAKRARVADLPMDFALDDGDALMPARPLSSAKSVQIEARVSKSGDAKSMPGDLTGSAGPVKPGAKGLRLVIDKVVP
ncbi:MAG: c-type cytochrome biogenesis protein CcmI [Rhodocyclales bacterium]|nr:c-type cytochrome biogenesis protein CcmI [Rhodocyclales bacterium]